LEKIKEFIKSETNREAFVDEVVNEQIEKTQDVTMVGVSQHNSSVSKLKVDEVMFDPCGFSLFLPNNKCTKDVILNMKDYVPEKIWEGCPSPRPTCDVSVSITSENIVNITLKKLIKNSKNVDLSVDISKNEEEEEEEEEKNTSNLSSQIFSYFLLFGVILLLWAGGFFG
jgi:DNA-directed RNA polymerase subunit M/transcription elongation factor TFIIS